jgi:hypothetical protein
VVVVVVMVFLVVVFVVPVALVPAVARPQRFGGQVDVVGLIVDETAGCE